MIVDIRTKQLNHKPVEKMLNSQYEEWKTIKGDIDVDTTEENDIDKIVNLIVYQ